VPDEEPPFVPLGPLEGPPCDGPPIGPLLDCCEPPELPPLELANDELPE